MKKTLYAAVYENPDIGRREIFGPLRETKEEVEGKPDDTGYLGVATVTYEVPYKDPEFILGHKYREVNRLTGDIWYYLPEPNTWGSFVNPFDYNPTWHRRDELPAELEDVTPKEVL